MLFPQLVQLITRYADEKFEALEPSDMRDLFMSPWYGWLIERLQQAIHADTNTRDAPEIPRYEQNRSPGSTAEVSFWTTRPVREVLKGHANYIVAYGCGSRPLRC